MTQAETTFTPPAAGPAFWVAIELCAGILLGAMLPGTGGALLLLAVTLLSAAMLVRPARVLLSAATWVVIGAAAIQVSLHRRPADDISRLAGPEPVMIRAVIDRVESVWPTGTFGEGLSAEARLLSVDGLPSVTGKARLWVGRADPRLGQGGTFEILGTLSQAAAPSNPGEADFAAYDALRGMGAEIKVNGPGQISLLPADFHPFDATLAWWRRSARACLRNGFDAASPDLLLLQSLFLGDNDPRLAPVRDDFQHTGTTHHLAVSGTHIAVIAGFVYILLRLLALLPRTSWLTPRRMLLATLAIILAYAAAVTPGPPVTRSALMALVVGMGLAAARPIAMANLLGLCSILMLLLDPRQVLMPGFQLTFFIVWALITLAPPLYRHLLEYRDQDFLIADRWAPERPEAARRRRRWKAIAVLSASLIAWAAASPIVAHHFLQTNPYAALASILLAPVVFTAIVIAGLKVILTALLPWAAPIWAVPAGWSAAALRNSVHLLAQAPGTDLGLPSLPGWLTLLSILLFCVPLLPFWQPAKPPPGIAPQPPPRQRTRAFRSATWVFAAVATIGTPLLLPLLISRPAGLRFTVLSVGSAQCLVLQPDTGPAILIDAGSNGGDLYRRVLDPFLRQADIHDIGALVLTHSDADHTSAAESLLRRRPVQQLITGEAAANSEKGPAARALAAARDEGIPVTIARAGDILRPHPSLVIDILHPETAEGWKENDASLVLRITYAGRVILVTGDIEAAAQHTLLQRPGELRADILLVPHHGSWETTLQPFIEATEASILIASDDKSPSGLQSRFHREFRDPRLLRTAQSGAITVQILPDGGMTVKSFLPETPPQAVQAPSVTK